MGNICPAGKTADKQGKKSGTKSADKAKRSTTSKSQTGASDIASGSKTGKGSADTKEVDGTTNNPSPDAKSDLAGSSGAKESVSEPSGQPHDATAAVSSGRPETSGESGPSTTTNVEHGQQTSTSSGLPNGTNVPLIDTTREEHSSPSRKRDASHKDLDADDSVGSSDAEHDRQAAENWRKALEGGDDYDLQQKIAGSVERLMQEDGLMPEEFDYPTNLPKDLNELNTAQMKDLVLYNTQKNEKLQAESDDDDGKSGEKKDKDGRTLHFKEEASVLSVTDYGSFNKQSMTDLVLDEDDYPIHNPLYGWGGEADFRRELEGLKTDLGLAFDSD
jgi:hypothetical protein